MEKIRLTWRLFAAPAGNSTAAHVLTRVRGAALVAGETERTLLDLVQAACAARQTDGPWNPGPVGLVVFQASGERWVRVRS